jgi:hypothetical protein
VTFSPTSSGKAGGGPLIDQNLSLNQLQGLVGQTLVRPNSMTASGATTSGEMFASPVVLYAGTTVTNIIFNLAAAAVTITHGFVALYDGSLNRLALSADTTSFFNGTDNRTCPLTAPFAVPTTAVYYVAALCTATTGPNYLGYSMGTANNPIGGGAAGGFGQLGLSSPPAAATPVGTSFLPWFALS